MQHHSIPWIRFAAVALGATALASVGAPAVGADAADPSGACTDDRGVTVVVDFTDLGGQIEIGCATDASTGTAALTSAGFADARDAAGMICAIDSLPDPCPATFTGSYWSYWYAEGGEWQTRMEGSDTVVPVAGGVEGWRYNDGAARPGVDPTALPVADDGDLEAVPEARASDVDRGNPWIVALISGAVIGAVLLMVVRLGRGGTSAHGPSGQD